MKKIILVLLLLALLVSSCNYIIAKRDPAVLNSSILLSGEVTGDIYPEVRTLSMRASGQASNFLLLEIYGMESFCDTRSVNVLDSFSGNTLYLHIVDDGTSGTETCYRNLQFWVGPFERNENYTIHLIESNTAVFKDTLTTAINYTQNIDVTVSSDSYGYWISEMPLETPHADAPYFSSADLPDSLAKYREYAPDSIYFEENGDSLRVVSIFTATCSMIFHPYAQIDADTLKMYAWCGPDPMNMCETQYYFFYDHGNYIDQVFYYSFYRDYFAMFEGFYNLP